MISIFSILSLTAPIFKMNLKALEEAWLQETVGSQSPGTPNTKILVLGGWQKGYPILNGWAILTFASEENWERLPKSNSAKRVSLLKPKNNSSTSSITQNHPQICREGHRNGKFKNLAIIHWQLHSIFFLVSRFLCASEIHLIIWEILRFWLTIWRCSGNDWALGSGDTRNTQNIMLLNQRK